MSEVPSPIKTAKPGIVFYVGRAILKPALWLMYRPRVTGREHVPKTGPVLLVSNHESGLDTILIPSFAPRQVQFLAKASLFRGRAGTWLFDQIGAVPVDRASSAGGKRSLDAGRAVLDAGKVFAVFPEGTRSKDGTLGKGKGGGAWLALQTGATVVPVGLTGTNRALRDERGNKRRVEVRYGAPLDLADLAGHPGGRARREATGRIMSAIQALTGQAHAAE